MFTLIFYFLFEVLEGKSKTSCMLIMCYHTIAPLVPLHAFLRPSPLSVFQVQSRGNVCGSVSCLLLSQCPCDSSLPCPSTSSFLLLSSPTETGVGGCEVTPSHSRPTGGLNTTGPNTVGKNSTALERIYPETSPLFISDNTNYFLAKKYK